MNRPTRYQLVNFMFISGCFVVGTDFIHESCGKVDVEATVIVFLMIVSISYLMVLSIVEILKCHFHLCLFIVSLML